MKRERRRGFIIAVTVAVILILGNIADAKPTDSGSVTREEAGLWSLSWLADLWSDFKAVFAGDTGGSGTTAPECAPETPNCGDAGPGIDPEG